MLETTIAPHRRPPSVIGEATTLPTPTLRIAAAAAPRTGAQSSIRTGAPAQALQRRARRRGPGNLCESLEQLVCVRHLPELRLSG